MKTPKFEIFRGKNNEFFFRLKAKNGKIILSSEGYTAKHNAEKGIEAVREAATDGINFALGWTQVGYPYFILVAENAETIGKSEIYKTAMGAKKGIEAVKRCAPIAEIVDLTN